MINLWEETIEVVVVSSSDYYEVNSKLCYEFIDSGYDMEVLR